MTDIRIVPNRHGSADAACKAWLAGSLWGEPIMLSPGNIHTLPNTVRRKC